MFSNGLRFFSKILKPFNFNCRTLTVLGIETSFDDTGCAIVNENGEILGEALHSQSLVHLRHGGAIPPIARDLHVEHMGKIVEKALHQSQLQFSQIDAIATTVKPGLSLSLLVGARYGQQLAKDNNRPFIPIHHMEAHALTIRMVQPIDFPFLVLLISGGHCLLAIAQDVDKFLLLGQSTDDAPGEAFDKVARRLKMTNLPKFSEISGGRAIEASAADGDPTAFQFTPIMTKHRDCNFSFSGLKSQARRYIMQEETKHDVPADGTIPNMNDLCASFQMAIARHICHRVQRAIEYIQMNNLLPFDKRHLVVAGGVACNKHICQMLEHVISHYDYKIAVPPPPLCTDNGIMIAWNGVERFRRDLNIIPPQLAHTIDVTSRCSFGEDHSANVSEADIKCSWVKLPSRPTDTSRVSTRSS